VIATCRTPEASEGLARLRSERGDALTTLHLDVRDEQTVAAAAASVASEGGARLDWLINCAGLLHDGEIGPEKKLEDVDLDNLRAVFEVNAFGPLVVAKHFLGLLRHDARAVLANVSARVGSIGDNRLGGWYAYRASRQPARRMVCVPGLEGGTEHVHSQSGHRARPPGSERHLPGAPPRDGRHRSRTPLPGERACRASVRREAGGRAAAGRDRFLHARGQWSFSIPW
jgi:hypothetical protein